MLNRIIIMGRLGRDPEVRYTQAGRPVASFSLAVDREFKDKASGERVTDWTDKEGGKRRSAEVIADGIYFAGAKATQPSEGNADEGTLPPPPAGELQDLEDDGELPF